MNLRLLTISLIFGCFILWFEPIDKTEYQDLRTILTIDVTRTLSNPLILRDTSPSIGDNINGPSVIKVPSWIEKPLGKYYMYFAHHRGKFIRLAYAENLAGPWTVYEPGVLHLDEVPTITRHIASPDVHVDKEKKVIQMYFHGPVKKVKGQKTLIATSKDGISFSSGSEILGRSYFRVFKLEEFFYAIDGHGFLNRSRNSDSGWSQREKKCCNTSFCGSVKKRFSLSFLHQKKGCT